MAIKLITGYIAQIEAGAQINGIRARIVLLDDKSDTQGTLVFVESGPIPPSVTVGSPFAYFPVARYAEVLDLLRNERPIYLGVNASNGSVTVGTASEPIGDGEPAPAHPSRAQ